MRRIIIRAGMSPLDVFDPSYIIEHNSIGGNVGNLVYQYSVFRTLMTESTTITPDYYKIDPNKADEINEKYDAYVIPLADAFRESFIPSLRKYTELIKRLKIPVYVIGVGLRAPFEPKLNEGFPFDEDVKNFVKAVLDKSSIIGLRGEITSRYLNQLGFRESVDHTVIGCPSMYTFGGQLNIRETNITEDSLVCVNSSRLSPKNVLDFITRGMEEFPNHYFIPQWLKELRITYAGVPALAKSSENYPVKMTDKTYKNNRVRFPLNVPKWFELIKKADLSFGARLHGNITATIVGTPSILIPKDARMRELAEYHQLTHVNYKEITEETKLSQLIEKVDFQSPVKKQVENFDRYIKFLNKLGLEHIYLNTRIPERVPLDDKVSKLELLDPLNPISSCAIEEVEERLEKYYSLNEEIYLKKERNLKKQIKNKDKKINHLENTMKRKSVRLALKTANMFSK